MGREVNGKEGGEGKGREGNGRAGNQEGLGRLADQLIRHDGEMGKWSCSHFKIPRLQSREGLQER